jgi:hypothetical protein
MQTFISEERISKPFHVENPSEMVTWKVWKEDINRGKWERVRIQLKMPQNPKNKIKNKKFVLCVHDK